jgi:hypothetical protein
MNRQEQFTQFCFHCEIKSPQERSYAHAGYEFMRKQNYDEICHKSERQLYRDTVRAIRRANSIGLIAYLFLYMEINRIAKLVVDWIMNLIPEPPMPE